MDHVPDPYYEGHEGFELVLDMLTGRLRRTLLDELEKRGSSKSQRTKKSALKMHSFSSNRVCMPVRSGIFGPSDVRISKVQLPPGRCCARSTSWRRTGRRNRAPDVHEPQSRTDRTVVVSVAVGDVVAAADSVVICISTYSADAHPEGLVLEEVAWQIDRSFERMGIPDRGEERTADTEFGGQVVIRIVEREAEVGDFRTALTQAPSSIRLSGIRAYAATSNPRALFVNSSPYEERM